MNNINLKNKKVIILTYQTYHYDFYKKTYNLIDQFIENNINNNDLFWKLVDFLKKENISYFVGYLDDQKDIWFLKDLYESSYYQIIRSFDENDKLINNNNLFFDLLEKLKEVNND